MKKIYVLCLFLAFYAVSFSQLRLGILGGPHGSSVIESNQIPGWDTVVKPFYKNRSGIHIGFLADVPLGGHWHLQPGILYMAKGRKYSRFNDSLAAQQTDTLWNNRNFFVNYIEMPINLAYKFPLGKKSNFVVSAGPYFSFFYNGKTSEETRTYNSGLYSKDENDLEVGDAVNKVRTFDFGVNARAGFELGNVMITGFFSRGLSNFYQASYDGTFKHQVVGASFGFWLNKAAPVETKPRDKDKDGIPDKEDACPLEAGVASAQGCPDKDGDGIPDKADKCPDVAGLPRYQGCPIPDSDGDGINDEEDKCPNAAGVAAYQGCPIPDRDKDGVNDDVDKCPDVAGLARYQGCPIPDRDADGVNDEEDKCPDIAGPAANHGCPEIKKEIVERVNYAARNIFFDLNSDKLQQKSFASLDEVAEILKKNADLKLFVDGHSDNIGNRDYNLLLSQRRADAVRDYLVSRGIEANRIEAHGFGQEKPIADNATAEGRAKNRRVEMRLEYP